MAWTEWYGQNGMYKIGWINWYGKNDMEEIIWIQWYGQNGMDKVEWTKSFSQETCPPGALHVVHRENDLDKVVWP